MGFRDSTARMENRMGKEIDNDMERGIMKWFV